MAKVIGRFSYGYQQWRIVDAGQEQFLTAITDAEPPASLEVKSRDALGQERWNAVSHTDPIWYDVLRMAAAECRRVEPLDE